MYKKIKHIMFMYKDFERRWGESFFLITGLCILIFFSISIVFVFIAGDVIAKGDDGYFHYMRLLGIKEAINDGNFPNYINYIYLNGYGYASNIFYPDFMLVPFSYLANYIGNIEAYKFMLVFSNLLCGFLTFYSVKGITKNKNIAILVAILYTFCFYRVYDFFPRSALGEGLAFSFIPLVFYGLYEMLYNDYRKWYLLTIGISLMTLTHILSSILVIVVIVIIAIVSYKQFLIEKKRIVYGILSVCVYVCLVAFFLFPMIEYLTSDMFLVELESSRKMKDTVQSSFQTILGLFAGVSSYNGTYSNLGITLTVVLFSRVFIKEQNKLIKKADILLGIGVLIVMMNMSFFPWNYYPFKWLDFAQFPWRLLQIGSFLLAFSGAIYIIELTKDNNKGRIITLSIISGLIVLTIGTQSSYYKNKLLKEEFGIMSNITNPIELGSRTVLINGTEKISGVSEYLPIEIKTASLTNFIKNDSVISNNKNTLITNYSNKKGVIQFDVIIEEDAILSIPKIYYKGYKATLDGEKIQVNKNSKALVEIKVEESGNVKIFYESTFVMKVGYAISLITFIMLIFYLMFYKKQYKF